MEPEFEKLLQKELDKLPYTKHLDDGQYNDGQIAGFEIGARWAFRLFVEQSRQTNVRRSLPLTNQKLWEMAKVITEKQKAAKEQLTDKVDWNMLEEMWFDWLEEELFGNDA
jgi:hypothetical protein